MNAIDDPFATPAHDGASVAPSLPPGEVEPEVNAAFIYEGLALLTAFRQIEDAGARKAILAFVETMAAATRRPDRA